MNHDDAEQVIEVMRGRKPNSRGWIRANCPFCEIVNGKLDRRQCLSLQTESGKYHCFKCMTRGMVEDLPEDLASMAPKEASSTKKDTVELPEGFIPLFEEPGLSSVAVRPAVDYLAGRGITPKLIKRQRIGCVLRGKHAHRIVVPIYDGPDRLVGWSARSWAPDARIKYLYPEGMNRDVVMFNRPCLDVETDVPALVVEGVFDAFPYLPHVVAVMGKPSAGQVAQLCRVRRPLVVCLDGDAWREGWALSLRLRFEGVRAGALKLPPCTDPATNPFDQVREAALRALEE